ncbi:MAG: serine hydrolase, partial [Alphaproteobacteria bacterium]|nr:serine hydrolase [Alphaproteobacteria bacterium]
MWKHLIVSFFSLTGAAFAIETQALQVFMKDFNTGEILLEKNADQQMVPSSMSKIMTIHLVLERLKNGDIKLADKLLVSNEAWQKGGSRMFVQVDTQVPVDMGSCQGAVCGPACTALYGWG